MDRVQDCTAFDHQKNNLICYRAGGKVYFIADAHGQDVILKIYIDKQTL